MKILNLTLHEATQDQLDAGVVDLSDFGRRVLANTLTFDKLPDYGTLKTSAETVAMFAAGTGIKSAMIGGAPYFMPYLERALWAAGVRPLYAFSTRESIEEHQPDGSVIKKNTFKHLGFIGTEFTELN